MSEPAPFWFLLGFCAGASLMATAVAFARDELQQRVTLQVDNNVHLDPGELARHIVEWWEETVEDDQEGSWKDEHDDLYGD